MAWRSFTGCTFSGNTTVADGGALYNTPSGAAKLTDCTLSGNTGGWGGSLNNSGTARFYDSTITGNVATGQSSTQTATAFGGGIYNYAGTTTLTGTIVAGNTARGVASDIIGKNQGSAVTGSYNLIGTGGSGGLFASNHNDLGVSSPDLGTLGNYGGPTQTIPLLPGSPALGAGVALTGITSDQRGEPQGSIVDIGAFQATLAVKSISGSVDTAIADLTLPGTVALANQIDGSAISFDPAVFATLQMIALTSPLDLTNTVLPTSITGPAAGVTISGNYDTNDGNNAIRVFQVNSGVTTSLTGLTITGGSAAVGAGLEVKGTVMLTNCTITGNTAGTSGGGMQVESGGIARLYSTTLGNNSSPYGGAINDNGFLTLDACTVSANSATNQAGGLRIYANSSAVITGSTFSNNSAHTNGGGLWNDGVAQLHRLHVQREYHSRRRRGAVQHAQRRRETHGLHPQRQHRRMGRQPQQQRDGQVLRLHDHRQRGHRTKLHTDRHGFRRRDLQLRRDDDPHRHDRRRQHRERRRQRHHRQESGQHRHRLVQPDRDRRIGRALRFESQRPRRFQPRPGNSRQLRRADPDNAPAGQLPGDRQGHRRRRPHHRPAQACSGERWSTSAPSRPRCWSSQRPHRS